MWLERTTAILLARNLPINSFQNDPHATGHLMLGSVCVVILAIPAFYFQLAPRYPAGTEGDGNGEFALPKKLPLSAGRLITTQLLPLLQPW